MHSLQLKQLLCLTVLLVSLFGFVACDDSELAEIEKVGQLELKKIEQSQADISKEPRRLFQFPQLISFQEYKELFKKHYGSLAEEIRRKKLFLSKLLRATISAIRYKFRMWNYYLKINYMSDMTYKELKQVTDDGKVVNFKDIQPDPNETMPEFHVGQSDSQRKKREIDLMDYYRAVKIVFSPVDMPAGNSNEYLQVPLRLVNFWRLQPIVMPKEQRAALQVKKPAGNEDAVFIDHRNSGCFFEARSQGECGSCYAFAFMSLLEYLHCKETGQKVAFSEQYMVDCAKPQRGLGLNGCSGGNYYSASDFVYTFGVHLRSQYPYLKFEDRCPYNTKDIKKLGRFKVSDKIETTLMVPVSEMEFFLQYTPLLVNVFTDGDFADYGGGVHSGHKCRSDNGKDDSKAFSHAMLLVGSGREDGQEYWLFRNSHSIHFGEQGYYKLNKESNCIRDKYVSALGTNFPMKQFDVKENKDHDSEALKKKWSDIMKRHLTSD